MSEKKSDLATYIRSYERNVVKKGSNVIVGFGSDLSEDVLILKKMPLGIPSLDYGLGGGIPVGGTMTIAGQPSVGKTTLALNIIAAAQSQGQTCVLADAENSYDERWAYIQGVNTDDLLILQAETLEDTLNLVVDTVNRGLIDLVVVDSLDATLPRGRIQSKAGKKRDLDNTDVALKARVMSDFYPRILHGARKNEVSIIFVAQLRTTGIGSAFVTEGISGGRARGFYDLLTLKLRRGPKADWPKDGSDFIGFQLVCRVDKSKISGTREGDQINTIFWHNKGFDLDYEIVKMAMDDGIIERVSAAQCLFTDTQGQEHKIGVGKDFKVAQKIADLGLIDDVRTQVTGETE